MKKLKLNLSIGLSFLALLFTGCEQTFAQNTPPAQGSKTPTASSSRYVTGTIFDGHFEVNKALYSPRSLILKSRALASRNIVTPDGYTGIKITFDDSQQFEGKVYKVMANKDKMIDGDELKPLPSLQLYAMAGGGKDPYPDNFRNHAPYTMTLKFYKEQHGLLPGFIDLEINDRHVTKIKGFFWAAPE